MKNLSSAGPQNSSPSAAPQGAGFSPLQWLKSKRISYLTLPLLMMATVTEFVILATGWKYQQVVCLPKGMGVTFFGIGPIGSTILAVELLKLPLAIWTASRHGWQKGFMLVVGLPLICLLTFQLVKDMAVYEMGVALSPAMEMLDKATAEDAKVSQLSGELDGIQAKKADREHKLAELDAKQAKAKGDIDDALKHNEEVRHDAISLTDYQRNQLNEVDAREAAIIQQFNADTEQINKSLADLRARRETEIARDTKWNAEEARIDNAYKTKLADYQNKKAAYDKAKADYDGANFLKRQLMQEPVDPGVPPVREDNTLLKSTVLAELDSEIKAKEDELASVDGKRRDRVAQVESDTRQLREQFEGRSDSKRDEADHQRQQLLAAEATLETESKTERKQIDDELAAAVQKVDGIRTDLDAAQKRAEGFYEARVAAIRTTQVHRIATTVEIVRGLIKGERPMSIKATAKERGDILTDQISMVRIWVYPVLAFIVAFLPTLMVEIGFSTVFEPDQQRPPHRLGFLGRHLHWLYIRAGRQKILRAERLASEASAKVAGLNKALATAKAVADKAVADKETALQGAEESANAVAGAHAEELAINEEHRAAQLKSKEEEWSTRLAGAAESLDRTIAEKDALRDLQKAELARQIQTRQTEWSERLAQLTLQLDEQSAAADRERTAMTQAHQRKLLEVSEDLKNQVAQVRTQAAEAEITATAASARLERELKEAAQAREDAESQIKQQAESFSAKSSLAKDEAARDLEKAARQEKQRLERLQAESEKTMRLREEDFERQLKQREQELSLGFETRLAEERTRIEQDYRRRETELQHQIEVRALEADARWKQEMQQQNETTHFRLKQREQQLQSQAEGRISQLQTQAEQELRRRGQELERQLEAQTRDFNARVKQELQQKDMAFEARLKQREHEFTLKTEARETELQNQWGTDLRAREEEWERQAESRVHAAEARLAHEAEQKEALVVSKSRQQDQQWQGRLDAVRAEVQAQTEEIARRRGLEAEAATRELEIELRKEMQQKDEAAQAKAKQREQELVTQLTVQAEARRMTTQAQWEAESDLKLRAAVEPLKAQLARAEKERDEAKHAHSEGARHVQHLETKLTEASSFLNSWRNGKNLVASE